MTRFKFLLVMFALFLMTLPSTASAVDGQKILEEIDRNLQPGDLEMYRKIINIEPDGKKKEYVFRFLLSIRTSCR